MAGNAASSGGPQRSGWLRAAWVVATLILLLPMVAMQFTDEVVWGTFDFVVAGVLLYGSVLTYELVAGKAGSFAYRTAVGIAVVAALLLVWVNLAVGVIGDEGNPANLMYLGVLGVGVVGALIARFQARGMARAWFAAALAQMLVAVIALTAGLDPGSGPFEIVALNGIFAALFVASALLFRRAARGVPQRGAA